MLKTITLVNETSKSRLTEKEAKTCRVTQPSTILDIRRRYLQHKDVNVPGDVWIQNYYDNVGVNLDDSHVPEGGARLRLSRPGGPEEEGWIMLYVSRPKEHKDLPLEEAKTSFIRVWISKREPAEVLYQRIVSKFSYNGFFLHCHRTNTQILEDRKPLERYGLQDCDTLTLLWTESARTIISKEPLYNAVSLLKANRQDVIRRSQHGKPHEVFEKANLLFSPISARTLPADMDGYVLDFDSTGRASEDPFPWEKGHFVAVAQRGTNDLCNLFPLSVQANLIDELDGGRLPSRPGEPLKKIVRRSSSPSPQSSYNGPLSNTSHACPFTDPAQTVNGRMHALATRQPLSPGEHSAYVRHDFHLDAPILRSRIIVDEAPFLPQWAYQQAMAPLPSRGALPLRYYWASESREEPQPETPSAQQKVKKF